MNEETPIILLSKHGIRMVLGGYWDGRLVIKNFTTNQEIFKKKHLYRITCLSVSPSEETMITGTERGDIAKWSMNEKTVKFQRPFFHHESAVTNAVINEGMGIFATCSKDCTVNLYTLSPAFILRSFKQPDEMPLSRVLISEAPLASIVMVSEDQKTITTFSINGRMLTSYTDSKEILNPIIMTDSNFNERLIFGNVIGKITILKLPYLNDPEIKPGLEKSSAVPLAVTPDRRVLIYYNMGLCYMGDFTSPLPAESKDLKAILDFIRRK